MHENRETSLVSAQADRSGKANNHNPGMYAKEESDCAVVPMKQPNKEARRSAEVAEGRVRTKENVAESDTCPTQCGVTRDPGVPWRAPKCYALTLLIRGKSRMR